MSAQSELTCGLKLILYIYFPLLLESSLVFQGILRTLDSEFDGDTNLHCMACMYYASWKGWRKSEKPWNIALRCGRFFHVTCVIFVVGDGVDIFIHSAG